MTKYTIAPITQTHTASFNAAVDSVARERCYLAFLKGPSMPMTRDFVLENIRDKWPHFIALYNNIVIGWCDITSLHRDVFIHAGSLGIGVIKQYRGQGIGGTLIQTALNAAKEKGLTRIELSVRETNINAIALYNKLGFIKEGFHQNAVCIDGKYEHHISMALLFNR